MAEVLSVVELQALSGLVKDVAVNHFNFRTPTASVPTSTELDNITTALTNFYNTGYGSPSHAICNAISTAMAHSSTITKIKHYNVSGHLDGTRHGAPLRTDLFALGSAIGTGSNLPGEVSVCLTFQTPYLTDPEFGPSGSRPRARDRGRVYLGPLRDAVRILNASNVPIIDPDWRQAFGAAAAALVADTNTQWVIWSRANVITNTVSNGWVDEAFDTQRRRGPVSTARSLWP